MKTSLSTVPCALTGALSLDVIVADIAALFANTDLTQDAQCHSTGEFCPGPFASAGIDIATGAALPEQTLFRVE